MNQSELDSIYRRLDRHHDRLDSVEHRLPRTLNISKEIEEIKRALGMDLEDGRKGTITEAHEGLSLAVRNEGRIDSFGIVQTEMRNRLNLISILLIVVGLLFLVMDMIILVRVF